jgi:phenylalanyl-tRNA synthetase beta subunit
MDRSLTDEEINGLQEAVRQGVSEQLKVELR